MRFAWTSHHATKSGNPGTMRGKITAPSFDRARETLTARAMKAGRSKVDLHLVDITPTTKEG